MSLNDLLKLDQYAPEDWGADIDYDSWDDRTNTSQVFVHWGGPPVRDSAADGNVNGEKAQLRAYEDFHVRGKGWRGLAYDWAIGQSGTLYRVRGAAKSAATSGDVDEDGFHNNVEGEAILCMVGQGQEPSEAMLTTLAKVIETLEYEEVYTHEEAGGIATACPGPELRAWVEAFRSGADEAPDASDDDAADEDVDEDEKPSEKPSSKKEWYDVKVPLVKRGQRSQHVRIVQYLLGLYGNSVNVDGIFGPETERGVRGFQSKRGLYNDGIVGPKTWGALLQSPR